MGSADSLRVGAGLAERPVSDWRVRALRCMISAQPLGGEGGLGVLLNQFSQSSPHNEAPVKPLDSKLGWMSSQLLCSVHCHPPTPGGGVCP